MLAEANTETGYHIALLSIRLLTGILFIAQGYDKLFSLGISKVMEPFAQIFIKVHIPTPALRLAILISSVIEFGGGLLLVTGFFRDYALYLLLLNLLFVAIGFCIIRPLWDLQHYFPRFVLVVGLLLLPSAWDAWRLDHFFY